MIHDGGSNPAGISREPGAVLRSFECTIAHLNVVKEGPAQIDRSEQQQQ